MFSGYVVKQEELIDQGKLLKEIDDPSDLRKLDREQLPVLCTELRDYIVNSVAAYGGHFGASLGVVELTTALHYVFNTPDDKLIWDVGHQAYGHKILTGRKDRFHTNRVYKGMSGFPKMSESEYDAFGVGHSSTSISAALGMAVASKHQDNPERQHIAVIGDGAMTAGMAFEAMNHAGVADSNLLVVLNDNCMSIDPNVGALRDYLTDITTSKTYNRIKAEVWTVIGKMSKIGPNAQVIAANLEKRVKNYL
jgi:1-deoxy-D-xylulose-5-phosphate synthase